MPKTQNVSSVLTVRPSPEEHERVAAELKVPDPSPEKAVAILRPETEPKDDRK